MIATCRVDYFGNSNTADHLENDNLHLFARGETARNERWVPFPAEVAGSPLEKAASQLYCVMQSTDGRCETHTNSSFKM